MPGRFSNVTGGLWFDSWQRQELFSSSVHPDSLGQLSLEVVSLEVKRI
jgi:hypothetical protein